MSRAQGCFSPRRTKRSDQKHSGCCCILLEEQREAAANQMASSCKLRDIPETEYALKWGKVGRVNSALEEVKSTVR